MKQLKVFGWVIFFLASLLITSTMGTEYYQYRDENGVLHFTDNLNDVPAGQRSQADRFEKIESKGVEEVKKAAPAANQPQATGDKGFKELAPDQLLQELNQEKKALETDYNDLMKKVAQLEEEKKKVKTAETAATYRQQVDAVNQEITRYEERRAAFDKKLQLYKQKNPNATQE